MNNLSVLKEEEEEGEEEKKERMDSSGVVIDECYIYKEETHLTVLKSSLFFSGDGFAVYDHRGQHVFRVDSCGPDIDKNQLVLMNPSGKCLLTVRRKYPSLHQRWEGFIGDRTEGQDPLFSVRRTSMIGRSGLMVHMYNNANEKYSIEGSYVRRHCTIFNEENESVAEIRRKVDISSNVRLGRDVFWLSLKPGFDGAFAMGLILVLDQIHGHDYFDEIQGHNYFDPYLALTLYPAKGRIHPSKIGGKSHSHVWIQTQECAVYVKVKVILQHRHDLCIGQLPQPFKNNKPRGKISHTL